MGFLKRFLLTVQTFFSAVFRRRGEPKSKDPEITRLKTVFRRQEPPLLVKMQVQSFFGTAVFALFKNSYSIQKVLEETVCHETPRIAEDFCGRLIMTGFDEETRVLYESLSYAAMREAVEAGGLEQEGHIEESQRKNMEIFSGKLLSPAFYQIEEVISSLKILYDICRFPYEATILLFDPAFHPENKQLPEGVLEVPLNALKSFLMDFYYLTASFSITKPAAFALVALYTMRSVKGENSDLLVERLKRLNGVLKHPLNPGNLLSLYRILCDDSQASLQTITVHSNALTDFISRMNENFQRNQKRIHYDLLDEKVNPRVQEAFGSVPVEEPAGYNSATSAVLKEFCHFSFFWVVPLKILYTFGKNYFAQETRILLDELCKEGLFWNHSYHSNLTMLLGQCTRSHERIMKLERTFSQVSGRYRDLFDLAVNYGTRKNEASPEAIIALAENANMEAQDIVCEETIHFFNLYGRISDVIQDMDKHDPTFVSNIKQVWGARENNARRVVLQEGLPVWEKFFDLMRNYVTIGG